MCFCFCLENTLHIKAEIQIHFVLICALICSLDELTLVAESQSQCADLRQSEFTDFTEKGVVYGHIL